MPFKAVAFDLDGTLVMEKSSWWKLHQYFGTYNQSLSNMRDYEQGKITYSEFMSLDIGLWQPRPHKSVIEKVLLSYNLTPNLLHVIKVLKSKEYQLFIITTAPDILANAVAGQLGIKYVASNGFTFDEKGYLTKNAIFNVDLVNKDQAFVKLLSLTGIMCKDCIAVGDSKYDKRFLTASGLGIAFNPDATLQKEAKIIIKDMKEILDYI